MESKVATMSDFPKASIHPSKGVKCLNRNDFNARVTS